MATRRRTPHHQGFTLVEVLVAILILLVGVIAALRIFPPGFNAMSETQRSYTGLRLLDKTVSAFEQDPDTVPEGIFPLDDSMMPAQITEAPVNFFDDLRSVDFQAMDNDWNWFAKHFYPLGASATVPTSPWPLWQPVSTRAMRRVQGERCVIPSELSFGLLAVVTGDNGGSTQIDVDDSSQLAPGMRIRIRHYNSGSGTYVINTCTIDTVPSSTRITVLESVTVAAGAAITPADALGYSPKHFPRFGPILPDGTVEYVSGRRLYTLRESNSELTPVSVYDLRYRRVSQSELDYLVQTKAKNALVGSITFDGQGLNDLTVSGTFTGSEATTYRVEIDGAGAPDTFRWSDGVGAGWDEELVPIPAPGTGYALNNGVVVSFEHDAGHTLLANTGWSFTVENPSDKLYYACDYQQNRIYLLPAPAKRAVRIAYYTYNATNGSIASRTETVTINASTSQALDTVSVPVNASERVIPGSEQVNRAYHFNPQAALDASQLASGQYYMDIVGVLTAPAANGTAILQVNKPELFSVGQDVQIRTADGSATQTLGSVQSIDVAADTITVETALAQSYPIGALVIPNTLADNLILGAIYFSREDAGRKVKIDYTIADWNILHEDLAVDGEGFFTLSVEDPKVRNTGRSARERNTWGLYGPMQPDGASADNIVMGLLDLRTGYTYYVVTNTATKRRPDYRVVSLSPSAPALAIDLTRAQYGRIRLGKVGSGGTEWEALNGTTYRVFYRAERNWMLQVYRPPAQFLFTSDQTTVMWKEFSVENQTINSQVIYGKTVYVPAVYAGQTVAVDYQYDEPLCTVTQNATAGDTTLTVNNTGQLAVDMKLLLMVFNKQTGELGAVERYTVTGITSTTDFTLDSTTAPGTGLASDIDLTNQRVQLVPDRTTSSNAQWPPKRVSGETHTIPAWQQGESTRTFRLRHIPAAGTLITLRGVSVTVRALWLQPRSGEVVQFSRSAIDANNKLPIVTRIPDRWQSRAVTITLPFTK
jgi:prepilin-type N-terminal cleavage/methylation domain-containing protein